MQASTGSERAVTRRMVNHAMPWGLVGLMAGTATISHGLRPLAGYRAVELDASAFQLGLLAAAFAIGALLFAVPGGRAVDRVGPGPVIMGACLLLPISTGVAVLAQTLPILMVSAVIFGIGQMLAVVALQAAVARGRTISQLDRVFGWLMAGTSVGQILGPLLALALPSLLSSGSTTVGLLFLVGVSLVLAVCGIVLGSRVPSSASRARPRIKASRLGVLRVAGMPAAMATSGVVVACLDLLTVFLPLWADDNGVSQFAAGILLATRGAVSLVSRIGLVRLPQLVSRRILIIGSTCAGATAFALLPILNLWGALAAMIVIGFGFGLVQPLTLTWVASVVSADTRGAALGLRMLSNRMLQVVIPIGVGALAQPLSFLGTASSRSLLIASATLYVTALASARAPWRASDSSD